MKVLIRKLSEKSIIPEYKTLGSSGFDISACLDEDIILAPQSVAMVKTGLSLELPEGFEAQVRSRSGLALKNGVFVLNSPGTIDNDYRGELCVILANFSTEPFIIEHGMRIAQVIIAKYEQFPIEIVENLTETQRGTGGFGSTGLK
jgi:dUTP pyrophosphatase